MEWEWLAILMLGAWCAKLTWDARCAEGRASEMRRVMQEVAEGHYDWLIKLAKGQNTLVEQVAGLSRLVRERQAAIPHEGKINGRDRPLEETQSSQGED